ncbi:SYTL3 protein, partial [Polyodon spathula]|nr:SYTL3 protein [Polyodon spathula]
MAEKIDLHFLKELEREKVLEVLYRDKALRAAEEERIRKLKSELREIHWKDAKSFSQQYADKTCARCQKSLGKILNSGAVCKGCSHRICTKCRIIISAREWKCTVCYAYGEVKIKSGDWFFEERANKFPSCEGRNLLCFTNEQYLFSLTGNQESVGETLLKSYQRLSLVETKTSSHSSSLGRGLETPGLNHKESIKEKYFKNPHSSHVSTVKVGKLKMLHYKSTPTVYQSHFSAVNIANKMGQRKKCRKWMKIQLLSTHTTPYTLSATCPVQLKPGFIREEHTSPACQWPSKVSICPLKSVTTPNCSQAKTLVRTTSMQMSFPETVSAELLCNIAIVPPTPPPFFENVSVSNAGLTKAPCPPIMFKKATANEDEDRVDVGRLAEANPTKTLYTGAVERDSTCSVSSACTEDGNFEKARVTGEIEFCIVYNYKRSCLEICIKACKNLAYGDEKKRKCNPYIKTYLLPDKSPQSKLKTTVKKNTTDPTFSETLRYNIDRSQLETRSLQVSVWHSETLKRKVFLGEVIIPLDSWKFEEDSRQQLFLCCIQPDQYEDCVLVQYNGELCIKVKFVLPSLSSKIQTQHLSMEDLQNKMTVIGQLNVMIIGAKNLPSLRPDGTLNSFVKVCLILPDKRQLKLKTPVLKKKACPQWNHQLVFSDVLLGELWDSCLDITVWDHAAFGLTDRFLGGVRLERGKTTQVAVE